MESTENCILNNTKKNKKDKKNKEPIYINGTLTPEELNKLSKTNSNVTKTYETSSITVNNQSILLTKTTYNIVNNCVITINHSNDDYFDFPKLPIFENDKIDELIVKSFNGEATSSARLLFVFCKDNYIFDELDFWYEFNNTWIKRDTNTVRLKFMNILKDTYKRIYEYYLNNKMDFKFLHKIRQIRESFDNTDNKNNIFIELEDIFTIKKNPNNDFNKKLDANTDLICFNNGVYDLKKSEFRKTTQEDYLSMTVGYDYKDTYSEHIKDLKQYLKEILPVKKDREYLLTYLSIGLYNNLFDLFTIFTGKGNNGKSKFVEFIKMTFGDYYGSFDGNILTDLTPDSTDTKLMELSKKKIAFASRLKNNSILNKGILKFITKRRTNSLIDYTTNKMVDFVPNFLTFLVCNDIPDINYMDTSLVERLRCINFPTEFVDNPTKKNQKKIDTKINEKFKLWKNDFMLLLLEYYKNYTNTKKFHAPPNVSKLTNKYKKSKKYKEYLNHH